MYRIILVCGDVPARAGAVAAQDITEESTHRPWHKDASRIWDGFKLILQADNDYGSNGLALLDEFSDAISACIACFDGEIKVLSIATVVADKR